MSDRQVKQVIVMRTDLGMRKGKMVAQGSHASLGALLGISETRSRIDSDDNEVLFPETISIELADGSAVRQWLKGPFVKICVSPPKDGRDQEKDLKDLEELCKVNHIPYALITDAGKTEFNGVPTITCIGIGPDWSDKIDALTGEYPLL